jgi:hypothetical protein
VTKNWQESFMKKSVFVLIPLLFAATANAKVNYTATVDPTDLNERQAIIKAFADAEASSGSNDVKDFSTRVYGEQNARRSLAAPTEYDIVNLAQVKNTSGKDFREIRQVYLVQFSLIKAGQSWVAPLFLKAEVAARFTFTGDKTTQMDTITFTEVELKEVK